MATPNSNLIVSGDGSVFIQNLAIRGNDIIATNPGGSVNIVPSSTGYIAFGDVGFNAGVVTRSTPDTPLKMLSNGTNGTVWVENLKFKNNVIMTGTDTNENIVLSPNGTGAVQTGNLQLFGNTISSINSNGNIVLTPNGTGALQTGNLQLFDNVISSINSNGNIVLTPNGTGAVQTGNLQLFDNVISSINLNGNINLVPNGNGNVGVGTSSPTQKLHVISEAAKNGIYVTGDSTTSPQVSFSGSTHGLSIQTNNNTTSSYALDVKNSANKHSLYVRNDGNVGIGTSSPSYNLHVVGNINYSGNLYKNGVLVSSGSGLWTGVSDGHIYFSGGNVGVGTLSPSETLDVIGTVSASGKMTVGADAAVELENNIISSSDKGNVFFGNLLTETDPIKNGYVAADGSSKSVYDYYHASKVMDSYGLVPALSSNTSSSAGNVVGNGTQGLIAEYYKGYAWNTLMKTVFDNQINYGNNAQFMSKVREYSGSFNRMFSVKWSGNLSLPAGSYDLIIDDAILAPGQHTLTDLFEAGSYTEVNQPVVDYENSWDGSSFIALMNGMRLPYLSEVLARRELGVDLKAVVVCFNDTGITDIDAWSSVANSSQWQHSVSHYVSITTGGDGTLYFPYGEVFLSGSQYPADFTHFALYMRSDCRLFDTRYIDNDYHQPNMDANTNKGSWASKKRFAEAVGGRLPSIEEVRARKFLQCYPKDSTAGDVWIPCTNTLYGTEQTDPYADYVQIGSVGSHWFGKSIRANEVWPNATNQWQTSDSFNDYEFYTLVIFDNTEQSLSYNGSNITGTNIVSKTVSGPYTKKYSITVPDTDARSIEFSKNGQGYRQLLLDPQNGDRKRWLTPLDFTVSHSSVVERYKVFDGSLVDEFTSLNYIREPIGWVGSSKTVLDSVVLGAKSGSEMFMPRLFDVEGTVDGMHWKRLKSFGAVRSYGQKEFIVGSQLGCIGYRIVVVGTFMSGVDDVVKIALLQFKTRGYESFVVPSDSGKMINLTNTDEDVYITSNSGVVSVGDVAFKDNSLFVRKLQNETDIGRLIDWDGSSAIPEGYVVADGTTYSGDDYPEAYKRSLEDIAVVRDIVPALNSNSSSSDGVVVTGSETVPNGLIAHCYTASSTGTSYVYVKSELVSGVDIDHTEINALFGVSDQDYAAIDIEGYLYVASSGNYSFYAKVDNHLTLIIDDEPVAFQVAISSSWTSMLTDSNTTSDANPTYLSQGYHKIRCRYWENTSTTYVHLAMAAGGTGDSNISDSDIIPSSSFVPYLKEDYYKAFDKKDLVSISPVGLDYSYARLYIPGMEKNSMAIRSSTVTFYEYIGWYSSESYIITYFMFAPYNTFFDPLSYAVDFELQGSNDNSNWTTIQRYDNVINSTINYVNPYGNGYRGYRVKVLSNSSNASSSVAQKMVNCNELGFYGVRFEDAHKHLPRNLVPVMTSYTTPCGTVISGPEYSSSYEAWMAFDNINNTSYRNTTFIGAAFNEEEYIGWYDTTLTKKKVITGFSMYARAYTLVDRSPVYFKLQGTLDGFTWYDIETFSRTYMKLDNYAEHFVVSKDKYVECNGFRILMIAPNVGINTQSVDMSFVQVWAFDHGVFNVPNASGKLFKLYEGTSVLKLGKNTDAPYVEYDTTSLGTQKTLVTPVPAGFVSIDTGSTMLDVEDYPELIDKHIKVNTEKSLVPTLTSATSEGVVVSSGIGPNSVYADWHAFGTPPINLTSEGVWHNNIDGNSGSATVGWYNLVLEKKKILRSFVLYGRLDPVHYSQNCSPKKFNVQGTNDGVNWTTIETFSDVPRYRFGRRFIISPSNVSSSNAYLGFRLDILDSFTVPTCDVDSTTAIASPSNIKGTFISFIQFYCIDLETDVLQQPMVFSLVPRHDGVTNPGGTLVNSYPHDNPPQLYGGGSFTEVYQLFSNNFDIWWETYYHDGFNISPHEPLYIGWYNTSLSSKVILVSVFLHANYPRIENGLGADYRSSAPVAFDVQGTIDGTNWYFVEHVSIPMVYTSYRYVINNRRTAYKGYRLVLKDPSYGKIDNWGTPTTGTLLLLGELDLECVNESDLKTLTLANSAGKMLKVSNATEVGERLNDNLVEVGSLALDTLRGNNELAVGATRKWGGIGYVPRGFAVMRGQRLGTLDYPKVFEALVDIQTPFIINPAMTSYTEPYGVVVYDVVLSSSSLYAAYNAFDRVPLQDNIAYVSPNNPTYPIQLGWYHTGFEKKKVLVEFYMYCRYDLASDGTKQMFPQWLPSVFSVQGTLDGNTWTTIQTYDMTFAVPHGYDKGVFFVDKENQKEAYFGFRVLALQNIFTDGFRWDVSELSFYVIDEPSKPIVLTPKPLVPNYTDWDNPSGNLVFSSWTGPTYYPWKAFNNDFVDYFVSSSNSHGWASLDSPIDRLGTSPYLGEYIGWYNTQLLSKKVLIYTRWTIAIDPFTDRYNNQSVLEGFVQGTIDGVNWENIQSFNTYGRYIEYYLNNDNRNKAYYGFRLYITKTQGNTSSYVAILDSLQFMCLDEDEYFSFELPDMPDTLVNLERVQGIAVEGSIGTNSRGDGLSIVMDNNKDTNNAIVVHNSSQSMFKIRNDGHTVVANSMHIGAEHTTAGETLYYNFSENGDFAKGKITFHASMNHKRRDYPVFSNLNPLTTAASDLIDRIGADHTFMLGGFSSGHTYFYGNYFGSKRYLSIASSSLFTGQHQNYIDEPFAEPAYNAADYVGLIMVSTGKNAIYKDGKVLSMARGVDVNDTLPVLKLSRTRNCKAVFGVSTNRENMHNDRNDYDYNHGFCTDLYGRVRVNGVGEGGIWVCNVNGVLENGDYVTSCEIPGYGMKQDDDLLHNYTVAKVTMDCDFSDASLEYKTLAVQEQDLKYYRCGETVLTEDGYYDLSEEEKKKYTEFNDKDYVVQRDNEGYLVWKSGEEVEVQYKLRYLLPDGTLLSKEEYNDCMEKGETAYIAAFVGCTYHCG